MKKKVNWKIKITIMFKLIVRKRKLISNYINLKSSGLQMPWIIRNIWFGLYIALW